MKYYKIPIGNDEYFYTMPAPTAPDSLYCNRKSLQKLNINVVVSLLTDIDIEALDLLHEQACYEQIGIQFIHFPISDFSVSKKEAKFIILAKSLSKQIDLGQIIAIHCKAGIGRSSLLAAAILIHRGFNPNEVFSYISEYRGTAVPDKKSQVDWLLNLSPKLINKI
jgi:protein-tyrosine phosphatase